MRRQLVGFFLSLCSGVCLSLLFFFCVLGACLNMREISSFTHCTFLCAFFFFVSHFTLQLYTTINIRIRAVLCVCVCVSMYIYFFLLSSHSNNPSKFSAFRCYSPVNFILLCCCCFFHLLVFPNGNRENFEENKHI